jgi:hypothetical protein
VSSAKGTYADRTLVDVAFWCCFARVSSKVHSRVIMLILDFLYPKFEIHQFTVQLGELIKY